MPYLEMPWTVQRDKEMPGMGFQRGGAPLTGFQRGGAPSFEISTVDGAFSEREIEALAAFVRVRAGSAGPGGCADARFTASPFANGKVLLPRLAASLFDRIAAASALMHSRTYVDRAGLRWELVGPSRHVFYAAMRAGEHFGIHTDTGSEFDAAAGTRSKFTALVYLGDTGVDFDGGATQFYTDDLEPTARIEPRRGRVLLFDIDRFHRACPVERGVKAWIGLELIYKLFSRGAGGASNTSPADPEQNLDQNRTANH